MTANKGEQISRFKKIVKQTLDHLANSFISGFIQALYDMEKIEDQLEEMHLLIRLYLSVLKQIIEHTEDYRLLLSLGSMLEGFVNFVVWANHKKWEKGYAFAHFGIKVIIEIFTLLPTILAIDDRDLREKLAFIVVMIANYVKKSPVYRDVLDDYLCREIKVPSPFAHIYKAMRGFLISVFGVGD